MNRNHQPAPRPTLAAASKATVGPGKATAAGPAKVTPATPPPAVPAPPLFNVRCYHYRRWRKPRPFPFPVSQRHLQRVLQQVHPGLHFSKVAAVQMQEFVLGLFDRIADEASRLARIAGRVTITEFDIETACKLQLNGELTRHAISDGAKALRRYKASFE